MNVQGKIGMALQEKGEFPADPVLHVTRAYYELFGVANLMPAPGVLTMKEVEILSDLLPDMALSLFDLANAITRLTGRPLNLEQMALEKCREG